MQKKGVVFILLSVIFLIGSGCQQNSQGTIKTLSECNDIVSLDLKKNCLDAHYFNQAVESNDVSLCTKVIDSKLKQKCVKGLDPKSVSFAFENSQNNVKLCDDLIGEDRQVCKDNYYFNNAYLQKDLTLCENIFDERTKIECGELDELF